MLGQGTTRKIGLDGMKVGFGDAYCVDDPQSFGFSSLLSETAELLPLENYSQAYSRASRCPWGFPIQEKSIQLGIPDRSAWGVRRSQRTRLPRILSNSCFEDMQTCQRIEIPRPRYFEGTAGGTNDLIQKEAIMTFALALHDAANYLLELSVSEGSSPKWRL